MMYGGGSGASVSGPYVTVPVEDVAVLIHTVVPPTTLCAGTSCMSGTPTVACMNYCCRHLLRSKALLLLQFKPQYMFRSTERATRIQSYIRALITRHHWDRMCREPRLARIGSAKHGSQSLYQMQPLSGEKMVDPCGCICSAIISTLWTHVPCVSKLPHVLQDSMTRGGKQGA